MVKSDEGPGARTGSLAFPVRVKPGASATKVGGGYPGPYGTALIVTVSAPAVDGRASVAVVRAVAKALGVRPGQVAITHGATSRNKLLLVTDPPVELADRLARLRDGVAE